MIPELSAGEGFIHNCEKVD